MLIKNKKVIIFFTIFTVVFLYLTGLVQAIDEVFVWSNNIVETSNVTENKLNINSQSAILIEQNSGKILYEQNANEKLRPASVTKIMTILLIMEALKSEKINLYDEVSCSETAASMGGSQIWLDTTEKLTVEEMLKAICVVSANDCTVAMAEYLEGSEAAFVEKMNLRAKELGMTNTIFKNCHGIDEDGHETTAYDIALMSKELMNNHSEITKYTTIWMDSLREGKSELVNTNKLVRNYSGATGLKTGSTSLALYNLSATATRDNLNLIAVIMKAPTSAIRFSDSKKILDYGFSQFVYKDFAKKDEIIVTAKVDKGIEKEVNLILEKNSGTTIKKGNEKNIESNIAIENHIKAPIKKGQKLGVIEYLLDGEKIAEVNVVAEKDINKMNLINMFNSIFLNWSKLFK